MGKKDIEEKEYLNDVLHFADMCNGILFQGKRMILPDELEEADAELFFPDKKMAAVVRLDGVRYWRRQEVNIAVLALEYQILTDYHMVFRNMMAESLAYYRQWKKNKRRYSKEYGKWINKVFRFKNSKEFLSGMAKEDRFIPVILIVINLGLEKWDGATTLHEMLDLRDELKKYVNNYKLNIYDYHDYEDFSVFKSEVRVIFEALKAAGTESYMDTVFPRFQKIELDTAKLLETLLNVKFDKKYIIFDDDGKEWMEVCKAWDDHFKSGEKAGVAIGLEQGIEQGIEQTLFRLVYKKIQKNYPLDMIADDLEEEVEVIRPIYDKAKQRMKESLTERQYNRKRGE